MPHDWSSAYLQQAYSDYQMFKRIESDPNVEDAHRLYFLLKMGEKAGQSYLTDGSSPPTKNHEALLQFFKALSHDPLLRKRVSARVKYGKFLKKVQRVERYARSLHKYIPTNHTSSNCEYPWTEGGGTIQVPSEVSFPVIGPGNAPQLRKFLGLFEMWFEASGLPVAPPR